MLSEVTIYTDFGQLQISLGHNCNVEILDFLQGMLHVDKKLRKTPGELLKYDFIKQGEEFLLIEEEKTKAMNDLLVENEVNNIQIFI